eukprot:1374815-Lingulodinium_polyedra.AAC.1
MSIDIRQCQSMSTNIKQCQSISNNVKNMLFWTLKPSTEAAAIYPSDCDAFRRTVASLLAARA